MIFNICIGALTIALLALIILESIARKNRSIKTNAIFSPNRFRIYTTVVVCALLILEIIAYSQNMFGTTLFAINIIILSFLCGINAYQCLNNDSWFDASKKTPKKDGKYLCIYNIGDRDICIAMRFIKDGERFVHISAEEVDSTGVVKYWAYLPDRDRFDFLINS